MEDIDFKLSADLMMIYLSGGAIDDINIVRRGDETDAETLLRHLLLEGGDLRGAIDGRMAFEIEAFWGVHWVDFDRFTVTTSDNGQTVIRRFLDAFEVRDYLAQGRRD